MNKVEQHNLQMYNQYKDYLCLHCKHLNYWDGYYCNKRSWSFIHYNMFHRIKWNLDLICYCGIKEYLRTVFRSEQFLPKYAIKKCKHYIHYYRKRFWTSTTDSEGNFCEDATTVWKDNI